MIAHFDFLGKQYTCDLREPLDLSIPLVAGENRLSAWYVPPISIEAVRGEGFVGSVAEGGSVNFRDIHFNPHGHGTHTECLGHITADVKSVNRAIRSHFFVAQLITVKPVLLTEKIDNGLPGDSVILPDQIPHQLPQALIIRTTPNEPSKMLRAYSNTNPPYLLAETASKIVSAGVEHLLLDLPSVDREVDGGALQAHHRFWGLPDHPRTHATITELIYAADDIEDGLYLLNLQTAPFENDATPSRPVFFRATPR